MTALGRQTMVLLVALMAALALLAFSPAARGVPVAENALDEDGGGVPYAAGELLVTYKEEAPGTAVESLGEDANAQVAEEIPAIDAKLLAFPEVKSQPSGEARETALAHIKEELERDPAVESVEYNYLDTTFGTPNDPLFRQQYGMKKADFDLAWNRVRGRAKIAVVDSGIAAGHREFRRKIVAKRDFRNEATPNSVKDYTGHGTHVAGIAAARTGNRTGVAGGCPGCRLLIAKVVGRDGGAFVADVAEGIIWSTDRGADVINLSLGSTTQSATRRRAVEYAIRRGVVVVAAAGNFDSSKTVYPAAYNGVLAATATGPRDGRVRNYSRGKWLDVAAPGIDIISTTPGGYGRKTGTSMAGAHVSALAGLLASQGRGTRAIKKRILNTAVDLGPQGRDIYYGAGRINAGKAVKR